MRDSGGLDLVQPKLGDGKVALLRELKLGEQRTNITAL